ncbi:MAG: hypothetical protein FWF46_02740 [Oscillospiraceae bacterium]|nr:hypothetical protein [Oscillospiraceae bacterium]
MKKKTIDDEIQGIYDAMGEHKWWPILMAIAAVSFLIGVVLYKFVDQSSSIRYISKVVSCIGLFIIIVVVPILAIIENRIEYEKVARIEEELSPEAQKEYGIRQRERQEEIREAEKLEAEEREQEKRILRWILFFWWIGRK